MYAPAFRDSEKELFSADAIILNQDRTPRQVRCTGRGWETHQEIEIACDPKGWIKPAIKIEQRSMVQKAWVDDPHPGWEPLEIPRLAHNCSKLHIGIHQLSLSADQVKDVASQPREDLAQGVRVGKCVICAEEADVGSARNTYPLVPSVVDSTIVLGVPVGDAALVLTDDFLRFIIGAAVNYDEFPARKTLLHDRVNAALQSSASVERCDDDRYCGGAGTEWHDAAGIHVLTTGV